MSTTALSRPMLPFVMLLAVCISGGADSTVITRRIDSVSPSTGSVVGGTKLVIKGEGFSINYAAGHNRVYIGGTTECITLERQGFGACTVLCSNYNQIVCNTNPSSSTATSSVAQPITVTVDNYFEIPATNGVNFRFVAGRSGYVMGVHPSSGKAGTILNLRGSGWSTLQGENGAGVVGNLLHTFKSVLIGSDTARVSSTDGGAVCVGYNDANADTYYNFNRPRYLAEPQSFNSMEQIHNLYNADHFRCKLPTHSPGSYTTRVSLTYGDAAKKNVSKQFDKAGVPYEFQFYPEVTGIKPNVASITGSTEVTITGTGFATTPANNSVVIGGNTCVVTAATYNQLVCTTLAVTAAPAADGNHRRNHMGGRGLKHYMHNGEKPSGSVLAAGWDNSNVDSERTRFLHKTSITDSMGQVNGFRGDYLRLEAALIPDIPGQHEWSTSDARLWLGKEKAMQPE